MGRRMTARADRRMPLSGTFLNETSMSPGRVRPSPAGNRPFPSSSATAFFDPPPLPVLVRPERQTNRPLGTGRAREPRAEFNPVPPGGQLSRSGRLNGGELRRGVFRMLPHVYIGNWYTNP